MWGGGGGENEDAAGRMGNVMVGGRVSLKNFWRGGGRWWRFLGVRLGSGDGQEDLEATFWRGGVNHDSENAFPNSNRTEKLLAGCEKEKKA